MSESLEKILEYFDDINAIPRCSKNEAHLQRWLHQWASGNGLPARADDAGNLVVQVPASAGCESAQTVVLQGHMDMVCEKTPDSPHDFEKDPIRSSRQGQWLVADGTTLGADNGIAIAYAMALAEDETIQRPPVELLFTVDEETGLNGVKALSQEIFEGKILINLDSEDEGIFTIGCAGGEDTDIVLTAPTAAISGDWICYQVTVGGLKGGHSGIDIHKNRANANKLLARVLALAHQKTHCRLIGMKGGTRHNAIARDAQATIACPLESKTQLEQLGDHMAAVFRQEWAGLEPDLSIKVARVSSGKKGLDGKGTERAVDLLLGLPHGVRAMSTSLEGLVETSSNLAVTNLEDGCLKVLTSQRSSIPSRLTAMTESIHAVARLAGATTRDSNQYPPWPPDEAAPLLQKACSVYEKLYGKAPVIQVIHAGLECAIIGDRYPGIQMISFGPTIESPHCPAERLNIPSVEKVWRFLVALLADLAT